VILRPFMFEHGPLEVNLFVLADERTRQAVMIDAGVFDETVPTFVRSAGLDLRAVLITHLHPDHIQGLESYLRRWPVEVFSPAPLKAAPEAGLARPGETIQAGPFAFKVLRTSGHTPESVSYACPAEGVCFVGDAIFAGAVGGTPDDALHEEELACLRREILTLPPETELYSGHGPATTVAIEKTANPFLQPGFTRLPAAGGGR